MVTTFKVSTVPTYMHEFYSGRFGRPSGRFTDISAMRGFIGYQLRLVNALISRPKGFNTVDPETVIHLNPYLIEEDFDDLIVVLDNLAKHALVDSRLIDYAKPQVLELRKHFASIRNRSQHRG